MARKHHGRIIDTDVRLATTPLRAWQAWADPQHIANWFVDRAEGEGKAGEVMTWFFDTFNIRQPVPVLESTPGETIVLGSGDAAGPHGHPWLIEITIAKDGGETRLRLVNSGFSADAAFEDDFQGVVSGWKMALGTMKRWLERHADRRRQHRLVMQPAAYSEDALQLLFHTADGRERWLGEIIRGEGVLTDTGREVLMSWDRHEGVLGLKAFKAGPQQMLALDASMWSAETADFEPVEAALRRALLRLTAMV